jgi:2-oxoisovalerate dehydrogenase E1 component
MESSPTHKKQYEKILTEVKEFIAQQSVIQNLELSEYAINSLPTKFRSLVKAKSNSKIRTVEAIRKSLLTVTENGGFLIGEDICDPYGGAFKATRGISSRYPSSVLNSPISEAALVGFSIGRALMGQPVIAEIMFGDFVTYAFDQIVNNASKFSHVYGMDSGMSFIVRVPGGGHRGYGPTHSQSLEKHLLGIDNILVLAITSLMDPMFQYETAINLRIPTIVVENKIGYSKILFQNENSLIVEQSNDGLGAIVIKSKESQPHVSIITYGELARDAVDQLERLEAEFELNIEVICLLQLHPIPLELLLERELGKLTIVAEDGSQAFGIGAEIGALLLERSRNPLIFRRVSAEPFPIASNRVLEEQLLANVSKIENVIKMELRNVK